MILYLIKKERYYTTILPDRVKGQYWIKDYDKNGNERNLMSIEAIGKEWVLKSNKNAVAVDNNSAVLKNVVVRPMSFLNIQFPDSKNGAILFAEPITEERGRFSKYVVPERNKFKIGRDESNDIVFSNEFVSAKHAVLEYDGSRWSLSDCNSTNGTYVNGVRTASANLSPGDCIFIMGLKIIVGRQFIALNNPDWKIRMQASGIQRYIAQRINPDREFDVDIVKEYFFRSPRIKEDIVKRELTIDPPPQPQKMDSTPIALVIGPSVTMGMASMSMGIFSVINVLSNGGSMTQAMPMMIMSFSMLLGTVLWPVLTRRYEKKQKSKLEARRQQKYLNYLEEVRDEIRNEILWQREILQKNTISLEDCASRIAGHQSNLWERSPGQSDYLRLRVGVGNLPLDMDIHCEAKKFSLEDDNLQNAMLAVGSEKKELQNVPVAISFAENWNTGITGSYFLRMNLIKSIILQIVALHSYDECKICLFCDENMMQELGFVKSIRHFWSDEMSQRYLAVTQEEARELSSELERELMPRFGKKDSAAGSDKPYFVIIAASTKIAGACEFYIRFLAMEENHSISLISAGNELKDLPREVKAVVDLKDKDEGYIYDKENVLGKRLQFRQEFVREDMLYSLAEELSNIELELEGQKYELPNMISFLEMFGVGKIEHLNSLTRWKENNPVKTLQTPVGVGVTGELFMLDLHERFHGPHGLVAGMTGSGKSEFVITYILSLAVNYHPDEVAFVLIDYKGGGLAGAFEDNERNIRLPHLAGTITNLDGSAITRSLISIQSELRRRQAIFNEARKTANEGTMDIYKYQQLYRQGVVDEPVPHLFIISDEFAELKTQQPEFMEQLISAARIGRSLGVHLILATQKPSGVVDDQIWSNSKFRVCLKVQEKADSQEMIKRPDAAGLSQTGRFYLQVGFNELFALGQSAWCGAEYIPADKIEKTADNSIRVVDNLGHTVIDMKPAVKAGEAEKNRTKQVVGIVQYLSGLAREEHVSARPLWLPVIPARIFVDNLEKKYSFEADESNIAPVIGEYDDPYNQSQHPMQLSLSRDGNCLIYGSVGSGKEMFLTTLIFALIKNYSPIKTNLYIMDFGAETLRAFERAPHVGGIALATEKEKVVNLLKLLRDELASRKKLFASEGGDFDGYCRKTGKQIPHIIVILNNYAVFREQYEDYESIFQNLTQDGLKYGIYFVVTAAATNAVRYTTAQNFKTTLVLQLNDQTDYSAVMGRTNGLYPSAHIGRGLVRKEELFEFQTARCADCTDELEFIRDYCKRLSSVMKYRARVIPVLPKLVNAEYMAKYQYTAGSVPIGVGKKDLKICTMNLRSSFICPVAAQDLETCHGFVIELIKVLKKLPVTLGIWDVSKNLGDAVRSCFDEMVKRNNLYKDSGMDANVLKPFDERVWILYGIKDIFGRLNEDEADKLNVLLENGKGLYKTHFIMVDGVNEIRSFNYQQWYKDNLSQPEGLWIGDGVADQYFFNISKMRNEYYDEIGKWYGYQIRRGKPKLVKVLAESGEEDV